jgi:hypothetical protein
MEEIVDTDKEPWAGLIGLADEPRLPVFEKETIIDHGQGLLTYRERKEFEELKKMMEKMNGR